MNVKFNIKLSNAQQEAYELAHNKKVKYITLCYSRQSGKSVLMRVLCCEWLFIKNVKIGYITKNYILAKKFYKDFIQIFPKKLVTTCNGSDLTIDTIFGSTLTFFSAESGNSLRGMTFDYLICDEFAFFKFNLPDGSHLWNEILFPTVKVQGKKVIFVSTPFGKNNEFYNMYLRGLDSEFPTYASLKKSIYDDAFVSEDEIDNIKKSIPELSFRQEFLCEFLDSANTFFNGFEDCFNATDIEFDKTFIGVDLSANGEDNTVVTKINGRNEVEQILVTGSLDNKYRKIADIINESHNVRKVLIENNGIGSVMVNEIRKLTRYHIEEFNTTNKSKINICSQLAVAIANKEIHFKANDNDLYSELGSFTATYTKNGNMKLEARNGKHDDRVMSLAIALEASKQHTISAKSFNYIDNRIINII